MRTALISIFVLIAGAACGLALPDSPEPVLTDANLLTGFVRVDPDDKKPETLTTKAWLWQDGSDLVLRFEAQIDSTFAKGNISVKDEETNADYLRVQLITIPDAYYAYYYAAYPLGNLVDGVRETDMDVDYGWNSGYSYTSDFSEQLWTVTLRIPLGELRFQQAQPYRWKIILTRKHYQSEEFYSLPYANTNMDRDYFLTAQDIELSTPVQHKLDITFKPYFVKSYDLIGRVASYDPDNLGLDVAFNPGQRTRIKLSLNPDFSDIPMDSAQDSYNSKYPPYYEENRFFFTEDLDAFGLSEEIFYTRNIVQPRLAFKATGNTKVLNWGALGAFDKEIVQDSLLINRADYFQALAVNPAWRRFQMHNSLVSRVNEGYYNHVFTNAMNWEFLPKLSVSTNLSFSALANAALSDTLTGYKAGLGLYYSPGDLNLGLSYARLSSGLAYDAGYLYETDHEYLGTSFSWSKSYAARAVRYLALSAYASGYHSNLSTNPYYAYESGGTANLNLASRFNFLVAGTVARVPDRTYGLHDVYNGMLGCTWAKLRNFRVFGHYYYGHSLVYALAAVYPQDRFGLNLWGMPFTNLSLSLQGTWTRYGYEKLINPETGMVLLDDEYYIANATLEYTPTAVFKISLGSSLSTYEQAGKSAALSYYGNLRYEFRPEWFAFVGVKSAQTQTEASTWGDPLGTFRQDMNTAYAKLSVAF